jgi:hypothetical protein
MAQHTPQQVANYYNNPANYGTFQYQNLSALVNTFLAMYVGENKIISKVDRSDVFFFGRRAMQEMNYDILRSKKTWEFTLDNRMYIPLPHDFVGYTNVFYSDGSGIKHPLYPVRETQNPYRPATKTDDPKENDLWWDVNGIDALGRPFAQEIPEEDPVITSNFQTTASHEDQVADFNYNDGHSEFALGQRYGLSPEHAQINGSYYFDHARGRLYFGSGLVGSNIILDYVTDGTGNDSGEPDKIKDSVIHKFAEEAWYKCVAYYIVSTGSNYSPATIQMLKKERFAELRKAKLRLSNYKITEFMQVMRNKSKWIK